MNSIEIFVLCWVCGMVGFVMGAAWRWLWSEITDGELREANHTRQDDEHAIGYPEDSKMKSPDDWPRGGL